MVAGWFDSGPECAWLVEASRGVASAWRGTAIQGKGRVTGSHSGSRPGHSRTAGPGKSWHVKARRGLSGQVKEGPLMVVDAVRLRVRGREAGQVLASLVEASLGLARRDKGSSRVVVERFDSAPGHARQGLSMHVLARRVRSWRGKGVNRPAREASQGWRIRAGRPARRRCRSALLGCPGPPPRAGDAPRRPARSAPRPRCLR